jgi:hypothetical protein
MPIRRDTTSYLLMPGRTGGCIQDLAFVNKVTLKKEGEQIHNKSRFLATC